ncbi:adhesion protein FadA [Leptotrichia alba]|uniref:Adhesion protein FadA n=1 Tax=Leptotrichia alba TaxID=3239304 RepID=A0AB39V3E6_9FUSO
MKKKLAVLLGVLVLSSISFAAPAGASIDSLNNLESQLEKLQQLEEKKYKEQEALAQDAAQKVEEYTQMLTKIDERLAQIETMKDSSIFSKEFKAKVSEYKALRNQVEKEVAKQQQIVDNFEISKSIK